MLKKPFGSSELEKNSVNITFGGGVYLAIVDDSRAPEHKLKMYLRRSN